MSQQPQRKSPLLPPPPPPPRPPYSTTSSSSNSVKTSRTDSVGHGQSSLQSARKKSSSSSSASPRTGQACDRCKIRKIRCDNTLGGCIPCRQNNTECKTTDRITHRATARGHTEILERENSQLSQHIKELEQQLLELGASPKPSSHQSSNTETQTNEWNQPVDNSSLSGSVGDEKKTSNDNASMAAEGGADHYLGFSPTSDLGQDKGTCLSLFGMQLNLRDFMTGDDTDPSNPRSYQTLFHMIRLGMHGKGDVFKVDLSPSYEECMHSFDLYLTISNRGQPAVHGPAVKDLVSRIYLQGYQPSPAELISLHSMLAWIKYQFAARNPGEQTQKLAEESDRHYHYALTLVHEIFLDRTLETIQALVLLCSHARSFPMPESAWMIGSWAMQAAIDVGLHRSVGPWPPNATPETILKIEMRKRIFWLLFTFMTALSGKLGRPMPMHVGDYDIEFPAFVNDNLERLEPGTEKDQCPFYAAVYLFKRAELLCETYGSIYALRPSQPYEETVDRIQRKLQHLHKELPPIPSKDAAGVTDDQKANYMLSWSLHRAVAEVELVLHHPALCRSKSTKVISRNLCRCVDAANRLLRSTVQLMALNAIDGTWYSTTTFIAAIFTLLFAIEQRVHLNSSDLINLRTDMDVCLDVFTYIGRLLRTGPRLRDEMSDIINKALERISRRQIQASSLGAVENTKDRENTPNISTPSTQAEARLPSQPLKQEQMRTAYESIPSVSRPDHQPTRQDTFMDTINSTPMPQHQPTNYVPTQHVTYDPQQQASVEPVLPHHYQYPQYTSVYHSMADVAEQNVPAPFMFPPGGLGPNAWHHWAQVAREPFDPSDYTNASVTANTLMSMSGQQQHNTAVVPAAATQEMNYNNNNLAAATELPNLIPHPAVPTLWPLTMWQAQSRVNQGQ